MTTKKIQSTVYSASWVSGRSLDSKPEIRFAWPGRTFGLDEITCAVTVDGSIDHYITIQALEPKFGIERELFFCDGAICLVYRGRVIVGKIADVTSYTELEIGIARYLAISVDGERILFVGSDGACILYDCRHMSDIDIEYDAVEQITQVGDIVRLVVTDYRSESRSFEISLIDASCNPVT